MKRGLPHSLSHWIEEQIEVCEENCEPKELDGCGDKHDGNSKSDQIAKLVKHEVLAHQQPMSQRNPLPDQDEKEGGDGHEAKAADVYHPHDYGLTGAGPIECRVLHDKTGHGNSGRSGEECNGEGSGAHFLAGERQQKQYSSNKDDSKEEVYYQQRARS